LEGDTLADGDLIQVAHGDRVTCRLVFHFKDGSIHDETAVFSQRRNFRLLSDHLVHRKVSLRRQSIRTRWPCPQMPALRRHQASRSLSGLRRSETMLSSG
jgi:hypothetical protein